MPCQQLAHERQVSLSANILIQSSKIRIHVERGFWDPNPYDINTI
uniref:Uncharacterized protein n=1 Tax=Arundo donax TaxID=35708 RepID=A0A0A9C4C3_ARUDO